MVINVADLSIDRWKCQQLYITENMRSDDWDPWKKRYFWVPKRFVLKFKPPTLFKIKEMTHPEGWDNNEIFGSRISSTAVVFHLVDSDETFFAIFGFGHRQHDVWCHIEPCANNSNVHTLYDAYHKEKELASKQLQNSAAASAKDPQNDLDLVTVSSVKTPERKIIMKTRATPMDSPVAQIVHIEAYDQEELEVVGPPLVQDKLRTTSN